VVSLSLLLLNNSIASLEIPSYTSVIFSKQRGQLVWGCGCEDEDEDEDEDGDEDGDAL